MSPNRPSRRRARAVANSETADLQERRSRPWWHGPIALAAIVPLAGVAFGGGFAGGLTYGLVQRFDASAAKAPGRPPFAAKLYQRAIALPMLARFLKPEAQNPQARELAEIEQTISQLDDRLTQLETTLQIEREAPEHSARSGQRDRLDAIADRLRELDAASIETIALPADLLFTSDTVLDPTQRSLFDASIAEIARFPSADIYIASHTDPFANGDRELERAFSFDRAIQIARYLQGRLDRENGNYRWVAVGYGSTRPLATGSSEIDRQRNRRIELKIRAGSAVTPPEI